MITHLPEEKCANYACKQKLANGNNIGGFKAVRKQDGNWQTGYTCKKCSQGTPISTKKLALYEQNHHYPTQIQEQKNKTKHDKKWTQLIKQLTKDDTQEYQPNNNKMPKWNQVIDRMRANDNISKQMKKHWKKRKEVKKE